MVKIVFDVKIVSELTIAFVIYGQNY